jgi:hypothetical protein
MLFLIWETGQSFPLWTFESGGWIPYSRRQKDTLSDKGAGIGLATWLPRDGPWSSPRRRKRAAPWLHGMEKLAEVQIYQCRIAKALSEKPDLKNDP